MKRSLLSVLIAATLFSSCEELKNLLDDPKPQPEVGTVVDVVINSNVNSTTKASYTANNDKSTFIFSWHKGDEISIVVPNTSGNENQKFSSSEATGTSPLTGQIATWESSKTVFAIFPYSSIGYTIDENSCINYLANNQTIDVSKDQNFSNSLLVASSPNSLAKSEDDYYIPLLSFKQVMSFYQLNLVDIPEGEVLTEIGFTCNSDLFTTSATIDLTTAEAKATAKSSTVNAAIINGEGTTATINFAIIPVDLSKETVTLYVKTTGGNTNKSYLKSFDSGVNFERNSIVYSESGNLSLTSDFKVDSTDEVALSDISASSYPEGDKWVITDKSASKVDFEGLGKALAFVYSTTSTRRIALEFPNLEKMPIEALSGLKAIGSISAPCVTEIGDQACNNCSNIVSVSFPAVTKIGAESFRNCSNLTALSLPLVKSIGDEAFYYCGNISSVQLPLVETIGARAFCYCKTISDLSLPSVVTIGSNAFDTNESLTTLSLPLVKSINNSAFQSCKNITSISMPLVETLDSYSFKYCEKLISISMPNVTSVGSESFNECSSITSLALPEATSIGDNAFKSCSKLTDISLPKATIINSCAFINCVSLTSITATSAVSIGSYCFLGSSKLKTISLPSATTIDYNAFKGCISLSDVSMPKARKLGNNIFETCDALTTLELSTDEESFLESLGTNIFLISSTTNHQENVTLNIGSQNSALVDSNILSVGSVSYKFKKIIITGGTTSNIITKSENAKGIIW